MTQATSTEAGVVAAHERRLPVLDPLLPTTHPLVRRDPADLTLLAGGGMALLRRERPDPASFLANWGAAEQHQLVARVGGAAPVAAMDALLDQARDRVLAHASAHDPDTEVNLTWPTRDVAMTRVFLAHGLVPATVIAARPADRPSPDAATGARVRPIGAADLDDATSLWLEELRWDAQFGKAVERPSAAAAIRQELTGLLVGDRPRAWIAEAAGQVAGLLVLEPPEHAGWVAPLTSSAPAAYLSCLVVTAGRRGSGAGAALVRQAHGALDAAGVAVTLLHYAALNPLSGPFWHRSGYRPLWTIWHTRPASTLR
jgi:ribosomal protein S18 acetylase RimI-like enzyme